MTAVLLVPLREGRRHVHLLDDVPPADAGVIRAEGDLPLLCRVRNDAALRAPEVVVEQVLEPHAGDEQEVPAIAAALLLILDRAIAADAAVGAVVRLPRRPERLVELLHEVDELEVGWRLE